MEKSHRTMAEELRTEEFSEMDFEEKELPFLDDGERLEDPELSSIFEAVTAEREAKRNASRPNHNPLPETEKMAEPEMELEPEPEKKSSKEQTPCEEAGHEEIKEKINALDAEVKSIAQSTEKIASEMRDMHRLYHNEFAGRLKSMQDELNAYREIDRGRVYDGIFGEIARLYNDYESILNEITEEKLQKKIKYMFSDIIQILEANGVGIQKSSVGDRRNTRHCQVVERFEAEEQEQHDTVSKSYNTGFYIDNRTLIKERVDVFLFTKKTATDAEDNKEE